MRLKKRNPLKLLKEEWSDCTKCQLGERARNHVLYEELYGAKPGNCDLVFVGEGPGEIEDLQGRPFVGKAGKVLREAISDSCVLAHEDLPRIVLTNLVACRPQNSFADSRNRQPLSSEIEECLPRLIKTISIYKPKKVVALGRIPDSVLMDTYRGRFNYCHIWHPSYVYRNGGIGSNMYNIYVGQIQRIFEEIRNGP